MKYVVDWHDGEKPKTRTFDGQNAMRDAQAFYHDKVNHHMIPCALKDERRVIASVEPRAATQGVRR